MSLEEAYEQTERGLTSNYDSVRNPSHYTSGRTHEPADVIRDWQLNFFLGNVVKYISRAGRKGDAKEDLKKAAQYLQMELSSYGK